MEKTALIIIDIQEALMADHPYNEKNVIDNIKKVISICRETDMEVIYVRHDGGSGDELELNTQGWQIHKPIAPMKNDKIFDKHYNSAFKETGLKEYLEVKNIKNLIMVGMQTEHCFDTSIKVAFEYGYKIIIPEDTVTTYDTEFLSAKLLCEFYMKKIWNRRYAQVVPMKELADII